MSETSTTEPTTPTESPSGTATKTSRSRRAARRPPAASPEELGALLKSGFRAPSASVAVLAAALRLPAAVAAAVKAEHGWDDNTLLTAMELRDAAAAWLAAPANQGVK